MNAPERWTPNEFSQSSENEILAIVARLATTFGPRLTDREVQGRAEEYGTHLIRFSAEELRAAYDEVIQGWEFQGWPPPGAFYTAAMKFRKDWAVKRPEPLPEPPSKQPIPEHRVRAILDEYPQLSGQMREALFNLGTARSGALFEGAVKKASA